jgi:D-alanyl-D-alanine carboxypeptidase (penicillin-binding protein 5/6)
LAGCSRFQLRIPSRRALGIMLLVLALAIALTIPLLALSSRGAQPTRAPAGKVTSSRPASTPVSPTVQPSLPPLLTPEGPPPAISAASAMLLDADSERILADVNGETPHPMASTTKIMTAVIAIQTGDLNQMITVHEDAVLEVDNNDGSSADLQAGEALSLHDLLYALMLPSGDDAAIAIADGLAGSPANFARLMNLFAYRLHLFQTHYANPDGLPAAGQYTTAFDLVRLADYAMHLPLFAQIVKTRTYSIAATATHAAHVWSNTNLLLQSYQGATGIKTGYTAEAGYCLVFSATRDGHHLIGALLDAASPEQRFSDAQKLLNWGFQLPLLPPGPASPPVI